MKFKKLLITVLSLSCIFTSLCIYPALSAQAASVNKVEVSTEKSTKVAHSDIAHGIYDFDNSGIKKNGLSNSNDLITFARLTLKKSGSSLIVYGDTRSSSEMSKIGFNNITLQREENGNWNDYKEWTDIYNSNSIRYSVSKTVHVPSAYNYRVVANHYAEKPGFFNTQTYYNETTVLSM